MATHLVWFRADLRLNDNLAFAAACQNKQARVLALFIATPYQWHKHMMSPRQAAFILAHIKLLRKSLSEKGIPFLYAQVSNFTEQAEKVCEICMQYGVTHLFYNYQYELNERERDKQVENKLQTNIVCQGFDDSVILAPGSIMTSNNKMYKVFTPFKNAWLKRLKEDGIPKCVDAPLITRNTILDTGNDKKIVFDYPQQLFNTKLFSVGETAAIDRLHYFCQNNVVQYEKRRNFPGIDGTSRLSAYLTLGILSPRQCLRYLLINYPKALDYHGPITTWINELIWREFYKHILAYYPDLCRHHPFISWTKNIQWQNNQAKLNAWKKGKTGYPIVDAAMRQLNTIGWMHNRLRMITASFLVKDLLIDWRVGENYFISHLLDGDLAANNGGWQWVASTGTDPMPYFRIFNPIIQGQKFDPDGIFVRQWIPELAKIPGKNIHDPWKWANSEGIKIDYPHKIVDHKQASISTIKVYKAAYEAENNQQARHEK